jgi:tetratricopeptide (TPR) repeat protein
LNQGERDVPAYMRAGAMALDVFERQPDHPGAAHYVIHAFDDPDHAPLGLHAARAYSRIAPGAAHAQHMTTHIFLALGMWPDVIAQNVVASGPDRRQWFAHHYTYWLHYGLLQAGRFEEAAELLDELRTRAGANAPRPQLAHLMAMASQQVVTGERWNDSAIALLGGAESLLRPEAKALPLFTRGYAALQRGDRAVAAAALEQLEKTSTDTAAGEAQRLLVSELKAVLLRADGRKPEAEALLREVATKASALPVEFGPPEFAKPPWELLGEWYLADARTEEAHQAFTKSLALMPGRLLSVRGLARSSKE